MLLEAATAAALACSPAALDASVETNGASGAILVGIAFTAGPRRCSYHFPVRITLRDSGGFVMDVDSKPAQLRFTGVRPRAEQVGVIWRWTNWCGEQRRGARAWINFGLRIVRSPALAAPRCESDRAPSRLTALFVCPERAAASLPTRRMRYCPR